MARALALLATALVFFAVAAVAGAKPVVHHGNQSAADVRAYWTDARMKGAKPRERAKPGDRGGGKPDREPSPGASVDAGVVLQHGKVFLTENGVNYVCSGTAVDSANESVVWTAGHCVNEGPGDFVSNFMFVPGYRDGSKPRGEWVYSDLLTTEGWRTEGEYGVDVGAAVVQRNNGQTLEQAVGGGLPVSFSATRPGSYSVYGYPAAKKFNGQRLRLCDTSWLRDDPYGSEPAAIGVSCDMTGGSSGGGWVRDGAVVSVTSFGYSFWKNVLFGPYLGSTAPNEAQTLLSDAETR